MLGIIVSGAVAVLLIGNFLLCYLRSKGKYDEYMEYVDKEEYGLKDFIPLGLWRSEHGFPESKRPMQLQTVLARHKIRCIRKFWRYGDRKMRLFTILSMVVTGRRQRFYLVRCFH